MQWASYMALAATQNHPRAAAHPHLLCKAVQWQSLAADSTDQGLNIRVHVLGAVQGAQQHAAVVGIAGGGDLREARAAGLAVLTATGLSVGQGQACSTRAATGVRRASTSNCVTKPCRLCKRKQECERGTVLT